MKLEPEYIERLAKILSDNGLTEISLEDGEQAIMIRKELPGVIVPPAANFSSQVPAVQTDVIQKADSVNEKNESAVPKGKAITSPMVGTFYAASSPEAAPFVEVGSVIEKGDVICIIEAMKLMNEIKAEQSGKIVQICVKNGDPVEFGQVLMYME